MDLFPPAKFKVSDAKNSVLASTIRLANLLFIVTGQLLKEKKTFKETKRPGESKIVL